MEEKHDLEQLSDDQQNQLDQLLTNIPHLSTTAALQLLQSVQWDLDSAIRNSRSHNREEDLSLIGARRRANNRHQTMMGRIFHYLGLLTGLDSDYDENRSAALQFSDKFELTFGLDHPTFFDGSFNRAMVIAEDNNRMLFVYIHADEHDDTEKFCRECLADEEIIAFLEDNCVCYGISIKTAEGFKLARRFRTVGYPFVAVVSNLNGRMSIFTQLEGNIDRDLLLEELNLARSGYEDIAVPDSPSTPQLNTQSIIQSQNMEYEAALARDRERQKQKKLEEEKRQEDALRRRLEEEQRLHEIKEKEEVENQKKLQRQASLDSLPMEPDPENSNIPVSTVQIRLPDGKTVRRRFLVTETLETLAIFVRGHEVVDIEGNEIEEWEFATNFPRKSYRDFTLTLKDAGFEGQCSVFVREVLL